MSARGGEGPLVALASARDLDDVLDIARTSFAEPWDRSVFREELARDFSRLLVARLLPRGRVVGFASAWLVRDEARVLALAVHPSARRRGVGRALMQGVLTAAREHGVRLASLEVRPSNDAASALYASLGFETAFVRPRYYASDGEDARVMLLSLSSR